MACLCLLYLVQHYAFNKTLLIKEHNFLDFAEFERVSYGTFMHHQIEIVGINFNKIFFEL